MKYACFFCFFLLIPALSPAQVQHTFRVDMSGTIEKGLFEPPEGDRIILRGSFNDWRENKYVLNDEDGDGIYTGTFDINETTGNTLEYKYVIITSEAIVLWEYRPNPDNPPYGNRVRELCGDIPEHEVEVYNLNHWFLHLSGREVVFPKEELQEDFRQLRKTLQDSHCCLYEYTSKERMDELFDRQYTLIDRDMKPHEFYKILTPITSAIGCMHSAVWMPDEYWDIGPENLFPLQVRLIEEYLVVTGHYGDSIQVPSGSVILKINDRPIDEIISEMLANISADAMNPQFRRAQIEQRFPLLYARRFGFPEEFEIEYALPGRKTRVTGFLESANIESVRSVVFANFRQPPLEFTLLEDRSTAVLPIRTFSYYDRVDYFTDFLDSCFAVLREKEIGNLILDLRENDGGDPFCAAPLFSYLEREAVPYFAERSPT